MTELQRCETEIREHDANLRAGHPEVAGLFRALLDWRTERRLLMAEKVMVAPGKGAIMAVRKGPALRFRDGQTWGRRNSAM